MSITTTRLYCSMQWSSSTSLGMPLPVEIVDDARSLRSLFGPCLPLAMIIRLLHTGGVCWKFTCAVPDLIPCAQLMNGSHGTTLRYGA